MTCYVCGKNGHKRGNCPERISKIKCRECGSLGHYKNDCSITKERIKKEHLIKEQELLIQQEERLLQQKMDDEKWFNDNIYSIPGKLINLLTNTLTNAFDLNSSNNISTESGKLVNDLDIKNVLTNTLSNVFYLKTIHNEKISIYTYEGKLKCYNNNALGRFLNNMLIDDFMLFCSKWIIFLNISYDTTKEDNLSSIIYELKKANIVKEIETERDREVEYELCKKRVMQSRRHSTDWREHIDIKYTNLILDEYSKYKNGGPYQDNILKFKGEINFIYQ